MVPKRELAPEITFEIMMSKIFQVKNKDFQRMFQHSKSSKYVPILFQVWTNKRYVWSENLIKLIFDHKQRSWSPVWLFLLRLNYFLHLNHTNSSLMWTNKCLERSNSFNLFPYLKQLKHFSPVWFVLWLIKVLSTLNFLQHPVHLKWCLPSVK